MICTGVVEADPTKNEPAAEGILISAFLLFYRVTIKITHSLIGFADRLRGGTRPGCLGRVHHR
jgi:hypothetical protein